MGREDDLVVAQTNKKEKNKEPWRKFLNFFFGLTHYLLFIS